MRFMRRLGCRREGCEGALVEVFRTYLSSSIRVRTIMHIHGGLCKDFPVHTRSHSVKQTVFENRCTFSFSRKRHPYLPQANHDDCSYDDKESH